MPYPNEKAEPGTKKFEKQRLRLLKRQQKLAGQGAPQVGGAQQPQRPQSTPPAPPAASERQPETKKAKRDKKEKKGKKN